MNSAAVDRSHIGHLLLPEKIFNFDFIHLFLPRRPLCD
jgi:hypothetical protein